MINKHYFFSRRQRLTQKLGSYGIAVLPSAPQVHDRYIYRQDSDLYYLTGFEEPQSMGVFYQNQGHEQFVLLNQPYDKDEVIWTGDRAGQEGACERYGADASFSIHEREEILLKLFEGKYQIYYPIGRYPHFDEMMLKLMNIMKSKRRRGVDFPVEFLNVDEWIHPMRLVKDQDEINCMRKAAEISANAHCEVMQICRPGMYEYELKAHFLSAFIRHGAEEAYPTIVGGGENACVLHYQKNQAVLAEGSLALVDAGASYRYYASDITRTFPVNGRFTIEQAAIYELVLSAQLAVIDQIKPGVFFSALQDKAVEVLTLGLVDLGFLKGRVSDLIETKAYLPFFMHGVSHWLGIDVHDVGHYKLKGKSQKLLPGMVLTVEPGLYLAADRLNLESKWKNIGIRIEDDVLVTETGFEVLSAIAPKTIHEIEALRA